MTEDNKDAITENPTGDDGKPKEETSTTETENKSESSGENSDTKKDNEQESSKPTTEHQGNEDPKETENRDADKNGESKSSEKIRRNKGPRKVKVTRTERKPVESTAPSGVTRRKVTNDKLAPVIKGRQKTHVRVSKDIEQKVESYGRRAMNKFKFF